MKSIKDIIKNMDMDKDEVVFIFKGKKEDHTLNEQDKIHIRIMAILQLAQNRELLDYVMNHKVKENINYDKEKNIVCYRLKFIKERRKYRGDA